MDRKQVNSEQQRQIQLEILKNIDRFCRDYSIDYSLAFGTLIGAVRHRGYIPWDDDIDIMMTRDNYEKFRSLYKSSDYPLVDLQNDNSHPVPMGKVYDPNTFFYYRKRIKRKYGLFIDIFPFDRVPENAEERLLWLKSVKKYIRYNTYKNNKFSFIFSLPTIKDKMRASVIKLFSNRKLIHKKLEELYTKYYYSESEFLGVPAMMVLIKGNHSKLIPKSLFDQYSSIEFEGILFQCIKDYDTFLKIYYGNYMELPPVEQQVGKHGIVAYYK